MGRAGAKTQNSDLESKVMSSAATAHRAVGEGHSLLEIRSHEGSNVRGDGSNDGL